MKMGFQGMVPYGYFFFMKGRLLWEEIARSKRKPAYLLIFGFSLPSTLKKKCPSFCQRQNVWVFLITTMKDKHGLPVPINTLTRLFFFNCVRKQKQVLAGTPSR